MRVITRKHVFVFAIILELVAGEMNSSAQEVWTKYESNPVFDGFFTSVTYDDGQYRAWFIGMDEESGENMIGYATSADGIVWSEILNYSVFPLGDGGSWDSVSIDHACILKVDGVYKMWYNASDGDNNRIGYAFSADGADWQKYAGNPVLDLGGEGSWDREELLHPCVVFDGTAYHMWYNGYGQEKQQTGYATSSDGITWEKYDGNPVLTLGAESEWDGQQLGLMGVVYLGNTFHILYSAFQGSDDENLSAQIGYAYSNDGINWVKFLDNPVLDAGSIGEWDNGGVVPISVLFDEDLHLFKMWYAGLGEPIMTGFASSPEIPTVDAVEEDGIFPQSFTLAPNFPNPFNSQTHMQFTVPEESMVGLSVFNVLGQQVKTLVHEVRSPGNYSVTWDGRDDSGRAVNSGLYLYRLTAGEMVQARKLLYLK